MHRVFVNNEDILKSFVITDKNEIHHAKDVLRLKEGDKLIAFDGRGKAVLGEIQSINKYAITIVPLKTIKNSSLGDLHIELACAIPKRAKFDYIVEKTTELGVAKIIPLITQRTEVRLSKERLASKLRHWQNIAISAAKQSKRSIIPEISAVTTFQEATLSVASYDLALIPCLNGKRKSLKDILRNAKASKILVLIGPEGDFTEKEVSLALKQKAIAVTLGKTVLRVDTAAIYVVSVLNAFLNQDS